MNTNKKIAVLKEAITKHALKTSQNYADIMRNPDGTRCDWLFDIRALLVQSEYLDLIADIFWDQMEPHFPFQVGGLEVGAIPLVSAILMKGQAQGKNINGFFVRKIRKTTGLSKHIEGSLTKDPIVIVDDLINSGNSLKRIEVALATEKREIDHAFFLINFDRERTQKYLIRQKIALTSLFHLKDFGLELGKNISVFPKENSLFPAWIFEPSAPNYVFDVPKSTPVLDVGNAYYGADNGIFYAINLKTGKKVWEFQTGDSVKGIFSSPQIQEDMVIFGAYDGNVYALDKTTGKKVWMYEGADYVGSSPAIAAGLELVFIGLEHNAMSSRGSLVALDLYTGENTWEHPVQEYLHGTPGYCPEKGIVVIGTNDATVLCLQAETGELLWEFEMRDAAKAAPTFDLKRNQMLIGSHDWHMYGIDLDTGKKTFAFKTGNVVYNTPLIVEDTLYFGSTDKSIYIYDLKTKKRIKKIRTVGKIFSHPSLINGQIYIGSHDGTIRKIDPKTQTVTPQIRLPEQILSRVVYSSKHKNFYAVAAGSQLLALTEQKNKMA